MATLVLAFAGGLIAGPVGAGIGAVIGQEIDRDILFKPRGRQGPRLTQLAVQTSAYGTAIPKVFGTMRVAGCVIWSTDLIESRATSSQGKGQPSLTTYSYAVSFAVALSGRPILGVGRIWADGKLLRGAAGDFKSATGFRLHLGDEEQAADPLIASLEGVGMAPAHRGMAYAVFENFQLADYGNRIPSLTFEVIGDAGAMSAGAIVAALGEGDIADEGAVMPLGGFAASGDSVRSAVEAVSDAAGAWFAPRGGRVAITTGGPVRALGDAGSMAEGGHRQGRRRSIAAIESVPRAVSLVHYDPARDYQSGMQRAVRPGAGAREERVEVAAALDAEVAKGAAEAWLARIEAARERRTIAPGWGAIDVVPGDAIAIDGAAGTWRASGWSLEDMVLTLDCVRLAGAGVSAAADSGRPIPAPDEMAGRTILQAFEVPMLDDSILSAPRLLVAAAGTAPGWRRAALLYSTDQGASWIPAGATAAPATIGTVATVPGSGSASIIDRRNVFEVVFAHDAMTLANADAAALDAGANLALVGDELLQFGRAEQIGPRRWRLSELWRGRRGTEAAIGGQAIGDRFIRIERDCVVAIDLPLSAIGTSLRLMATGIGDSDGPASTEAAVTGASVLPPAPVGLRLAMLDAGDVRVDWTRRSRNGWRWIDAVDAPLGEEREAYRVTLAPEGGQVQDIECSAPMLTVPGALCAGCAVRVTVRQLGTNGESDGATITIPAL